MAQDLSPDQGFGDEIDELCDKIERATKGWGANKQMVTDSIATQETEQRFKLAMRYNELKKTKLRDLMKKEFSGDYGTAMECLSLPSNEAEALMLRRATKGIGASANIIWSIICGRTNEEIDLLKKTYFKMYDKDLGMMLAGELGGNLENIVVYCLQGGEEEYDPQFHTNEKAQEEAEEIYNMGQNRWGTDEKGLFKLLAKAPPEHVKNINTIYCDKYGYSLLKALEKELGGVFEGKVQKATLHMLGMKIKPYETMAALIKSACAGFGTDELLLTCCIIRFQPVMGPVMAAHIELFGKTVHDRVKSECGGAYKNLLLQVLNTVYPEYG